MTNFVPEADMLVEAVADYLEDQLLPAFAGYQRFQTRVCVNVLRVVARELQQCADLERREHLRLVELLGRDRPLADLNAELAQRISAGQIQLDAPGLVEHLRVTLKDALAINNPKWIEEP
jgi:hypothetical protein